MKFLTFGGKVPPLSDKIMSSPTKLSDYFNTADTVFFLMVLEPDTWREYLSIKDINSRMLLTSLYHYAAVTMQDTYSNDVQLMNQAIARTAGLWCNKPADEHAELVEKMLQTMPDTKRVVFYRQGVRESHMATINMEYLTGSNSPAPPTLLPMIRTFYDTYSKT
jgi:hypothetical protein